MDIKYYTDENDVSPLENGWLKTAPQFQKFLRRLSDYGAGTHRQ
ncbi:hypothetical protein [Citrobacter sedlakii]|nr:hypothetical protein [Citrobacter sedlakii]